MKTALLFLLLLLAIVAVPLALAPADRAACPRAVATDADAPRAAGAVPSRLSPHQQEIRAILDGAHAAEAELRATLGAEAADDHPAVRRLRRETTARILEIQVRRAASSGQDRLARRLRANLARLRQEMQAAG